MPSPHGSPKMKKNRYGVHAIAGCSLVALALLAGRLVPLRHSMAQSTTGTYPVFGLVRDFRPGHPDFQTMVGDGLSTSAGNVSASISATGLPMYTGTGRTVLSPAVDAKGRPIAPASVTAAPVTNFIISGASVSAPQPMAAKVTVIGAAIVGGGYDAMVTTRIKVGSTVHTPFGPFDLAVSGNVNDGANPRSTVLPGLIMPGTALTVDGRSWLRRNSMNPSLNDSDWFTHMTINSSNGGQQVVALRDGATPPSVAGFQGQTSAKDMLAPYLDPKTGKVSLKSNQVIYLFELGVTDTKSTAFDMQDLVVLVDLATDPSYFGPQTPGPSTCVTIADSAATWGGADAGGVQSAASFSQWFNDAVGENASRRHKIMMTQEADGTYSYSTDDFTPIDGALYGNQGAEHNRGFTLAVDAIATYTQCGGQFFEYTGSGDAWVYVNGKLALDLGGTHKTGRQYIDFDRLGLAGGQEVRVQFFYAQRTSGPAPFALKTNMVLNTTNRVGPPTVSGLHD